MMCQVHPKLWEILDQMPGCWACKDENSVFTYVNEAFGKLIGVKKHLDIIGRTAFDLPCGAAACAPLYQAQDQEIIASSKPLRVLDIHPYAGGEWHAFDVTKTPLHDKEKNIVGTILHGRDITSANSLELGTLLGRMQVGGTTSELVGQGSYLINQDRGPVELTTREAEVLFFFLRGKSAKTISSILDLSNRTVEQYLAYLKVKFSAANRYELLDHAFDLGYLNYIPQSLFSQQLSVVLRDA